MGQSKSKKSIQPNDDGRKLNDNKYQQANGDVVAVCVEQTADILKLDIDCCEEAFDYLPFEDLVSIGKTCKRLQQVAGYCFQQNYLGAESFDNEHGSIGIFRNGSDVTHFVPFIHKVKIYGDRHFQYFLDAQTKFRRLKQIHIIGYEITDIYGLKKFPLSKLEVLIVEKCNLSNNKFHEIIDNCTNLKRLTISLCKNLGELNWLSRKYPKLEYFQFFPPILFTIELGKNSMFYLRLIPPDGEILTFLELNPNIRDFATSAEWFQRHRDKMMAANIKLDNLAIFDNTTTDDEFISLIHLLNKLHERGFYRKLHVYTTWMNQTKMNELVTLNGLVKLQTNSYNSISTFSVLNKLEELHVIENKNVADLEILANSLINLKRIYLADASIDSIMPLIRRSVKMQKIYIIHLGAGVYLNKDTNIIDLLALNREREQLPYAQKITLYVEEPIYLATKWAMKGTDCGLIQLKRGDLLKWDNEFSVY